MRTSELSETIPKMLTRLKKVLLEAEESNTNQGCEIYRLVAFRIVEKVEKGLGINPSHVKSFRVEREEKKIALCRRRKPVEPLPTIVEEKYMACGRIKHECKHTRARKPGACGKNKVGHCYSEIKP